MSARALAQAFIYNHQVLDSGAVTATMKASGQHEGLELVVIDNGVNYFCNPDAIGRSIRKGLRNGAGN